VKPTGAPTISPATAIYTLAQMVTITDATPGAAIYYTTDGTTPTSSSTPYAAPFLVGTNTTVQAIAVSSPGGTSAAAFESYTFIGSPTALGAPATNVATTTVTLNGFANTLGLTGSYVFKFGTTAAMTSTSTSTPLAASTRTVTISDRYINCQPKTTYYFQLVVTTAAGTGTGRVQSFTTN
jgi:hypothetical protein